MTKADLQSLINTNLATASDITAIELRAVEDAFLSELYPATIVDTQLTTNVFTDLNNGFEYSLRITKTGNDVHITGYCRNLNNFINSNVFFAELTDLDYKPFYADDLGYVPFVGITNSGSAVRMVLLSINDGVDYGLYINASVNPSNYIYFNFNYKTNDQ